ncbi:hypothetical protein K438DRAFT_1985568 [Mycena galopus ATCC 62051]|nr:hypothetical protein K438DRAFT_1985563 [Mycena galopus ATCC 62051]KAF8161795.1 hypothetical protein K438DRAFT_1985568 [Mycena galopus ATCC 62051]
MAANTSRACHPTSPSPTHLTTSSLPSGSNLFASARAAPVTRQPTNATHKRTSSKTQDRRGQGLCVVLEKPLTPPLARYPSTRALTLLALDVSLKSLVEAAAAPVADSEKKKRKKVRKETFSSNIHNDVFLISSDLYRFLLSALHTHSRHQILTAQQLRFLKSEADMTPTGSLSPCQPSPRLSVLPAPPLSPTSSSADAFCFSLIFALRPARATLITTATFRATHRQEPRAS